ncbi:MULTISPECIES: hypothetical protein [Moraxella]|nr:hypothetical protein [Moraxella catarrhalis]STY82509.1 Uncharacterised protein [Moraxella catarrhalis]
MAEIGKMFIAWKAWFKNKMRGDDWGSETVALWAQYLTAKSITKREFMLAKNASFDCDFPPNNAREFLQMARMAKYPDPAQALNIALDAAHQLGYEPSLTKWRHSVVYETARRIGSYALLTDPKVSDRWHKIYAKVCQEADDGQVFSIPKYAQIELKTPSASAETVSGIMDKLMAIVGKKANHA